MIAAIIGLSILAFIVDIIALAAGVDTGKAPWTVVWLFPGLGLPVGFVLIIVLLIVSARRRSREAREDAEAAAIASRPKPPARVQPVRTQAKKRR
jgi:Zn-dependent protease with chaperone function